MTKQKLKKLIEDLSAFRAERFGYEPVPEFDLVINAIEEEIASK